MARRSRTVQWHMGLGREIGLAFWGMVFLEAAFSSYLGVWPLWIERLGAPVTVVGLVLGSSGILRLFFLAPSAALSERFNIRNLVVIARASAMIGLLAAAFAQHWTQLFITVVCSSIGELAFPLIQVHVAAHAGVNRIRAFTLVFTVGPSVAMAIAPLAAGGLIAIWGIRSAFILAGLCTAASVVCFSQFHTRGESREKPSESPGASTYRAAFADLPVRRLLILHGTTVFTLAIGTSLIPTFLDDVRGISDATISSLGALPAVGSVIFGIAVARTARLQASPFYGVAIAVFASAIGYCIFLATGFLPLVGLAFFLRGGLFAAWALYMAALGDIASEKHRARSFALGEMVAGTSFSIAPMFAGLLFALHNRIPLTLSAAACVPLIPVLIYAQHLSRRQHAAATVPLTVLPDTTREPSTVA